MEVFVYHPLPGLSLLTSFSPPPQTRYAHSDPLTLPFDDKHAITALVTVALTCAFGLRPKSILRPKLYSDQVRRHVAARLRHWVHSRTEGFRVDSFHFNIRPTNDTLLIDVYGCVRTSKSVYAYVALIEKPTNRPVKMTSLRVI